MKIIKPSFIIEDVVDGDEILKIWKNTEELVTNPKDYLTEKNL